MNIKEWSKKNIKFIAGGVVIIALAGVLIKFGVMDKLSGEARKTNAEVEESSNTKLGSNELQKDKYPEVNELINTYYTNVSEANIEELKKVSPDLTEEEGKQITDRKEIVEKYENIACYTKLGPEDDTYIVFAYSEWKFKDIETLVPGLESMYVAKNDDGALYMVKTIEDEEISSYIEGVRGDQDVKDLIAEVNDKLDQAKANDEKLKEFIGKLSASSGTSEEGEGTEVAKEDKQEKKKEEEKEEEKKEETGEKEEKKEEEKPAEEVVSEEQTTEEAATKAAQGAPGRLVTLTGTVHVRAGYNESTRVVYTAAPGEIIRVDMDYAEGWSKVTVWNNGKTGYIKTMYLK